MIDLPNGWRMETDQGSEWMFFRLACDQPHASDVPQVAEAVVAAARAGGINRVVMELDDNVMLFSGLVGQLVQLHKRFTLEGGVFRICGLSQINANTLKLLHLADRLPNYRDREAAVMGYL